KRFVYANRILEAMWGLTRDEYRGKSLLELNYPPATIDLVEGQLSEVFDSKVSVRGAVAYTSPTGVSGYYEYILSPVIGAGGEVEFVAGTSRDISGRKRAEELLRLSKEQLRAIYDGTYEYIGLLTPEGTLIEANRASLSFGGSKREDVVGLPFWETVWFKN